MAKKPKCSTKKLWSSVNDALQVVNKFIRILLSGLSIPVEDRHIFWQLHANLNARGHRRLADILNDVYRDMTSDTNEVMLQKLQGLCVELDIANNRPKAKLVLKAGITKAL
jgi:hypothetical protein